MRRLPLLPSHQPHMRCDGHQVTVALTNLKPHGLERLIECPDRKEYVCAFCDCLALAICQFPAAQDYAVAVPDDGERGVLRLIFGVRDFLFTPFFAENWG